MCKQKCEKRVPFEKYCLSNKYCLSDCLSNCKEVAFFVRRLLGILQTDQTASVIGAIKQHSEYRLFYKNRPGSDQTAPANPSQTEPPDIAVRKPLTIAWRTLKKMFFAKSNSIHKSAFSGCCLFAR